MKIRKNKKFNDYIFDKDEINREKHKWNNNSYNTFNVDKPTKFELWLSFKEKILPNLISGVLIIVLIGAFAFLGYKLFKEMPTTSSNKNSTPKEEKTSSVVHSTESKIYLNLPDNGRVLFYIAGSTSDESSGGRSEKYIFDETSSGFNIKEKINETDKDDFVINACDVTEYRKKAFNDYINLLHEINNSSNNSNSSNSSKNSKNNKNNNNNKRIEFLEENVKVDYNNTYSYYKEKKDDKIYYSYALWLDDVNTGFVFTGEDEKTLKTIFDKLRYVVSESRTHDDSVYYIPAISSSSAE